ncbi:hypothetical protein D3C73_724370 [compost metagenome]
MTQLADVQPLSRNVDIGELTAAHIEDFHLAKMTEKAPRLLEGSLQLAQRQRRHMSEVIGRKLRQAVNLHAGQFQHRGIRRHAVAAQQPVVPTDSEFGRLGPESGAVQKLHPRQPGVQSATEFAVLIEHGFNGIESGLGPLPCA